MTVSYLYEILLLLILEISGERVEMIFTILEGMWGLGQGVQTHHSMYPDGILIQEVWT